MTKYRFDEYINADGTISYEMFVFGLPWSTGGPSWVGRFDTKEKGIEWAERNLNN